MVKYIEMYWLQNIKTLQKSVCYVQLQSVASMLSIKEYSPCWEALITSLKITAFEENKRHYLNHSQSNMLLNYEWPKSQGVGGRQKQTASFADITLPRYGIFPPQRTIYVQTK